MGKFDAGDGIEAKLDELKDAVALSNSRSKASVDATIELSAAVRAYTAAVSEYVSLMKEAIEAVRGAKGA